jgi:hypothetical protein
MPQRNDIEMPQKRTLRRETGSHDASMRNPRSPVVVSVTVRISLVAWVVLVGVLALALRR